MPPAMCQRPHLLLLLLLLPFLVQQSPLVEARSSLPASLLRCQPAPRGELLGAPGAHPGDFGGAGALFVLLAARVGKSAAREEALG